VFRDRLELPIPDDQLKDAPYFPGPDSEEVQYLQERRKLLGGRAARVVRAPVPKPSRGRRRVRVRQRTTVSTTMVFARILRNLIRDRTSASGSCRSSRTRRGRSGDPCSRRSASTPPTGGATSRSTPSSYCHIASRRTAVLEEDQRAGLDGVADRGGDLVRDPRQPMIPFIFYSMFGFQRTGDQTGRSGTSADAGS
jgi:pyruvate dehydrogenase E1 component